LNEYYICECNINENNASRCKKILKNGSDFIVVVFQFGNSRFLVCVYDTVTEKYMEKYKFREYEQALQFAKQLNDDYKV
jgi:hypothetical protein